MRGHLLEIASTQAELFDSLESYPSSIVILAEPRAQSPLIHFARQVRAAVAADSCPILIVSDQAFDPGIAAAHVIERPYDLGEMTQFIESLASASS